MKGINIEDMCRYNESNRKTDKTTGLVKKLEKVGYWLHSEI